MRPAVLVYPALQYFGAFLAGLKTGAVPPVGLKVLKHSGIFSLPFATVHTSDLEAGFGSAPGSDPSRAADLDREGELDCEGERDVFAGGPIEGLILEDDGQRWQKDSDELFLSSG